MGQISLLGQVVQLLPRDSFKKLVVKHQSDKHSKGLTSWDHLVSMLFCQLTGTDSVRDISNGLRSITGNRSHLGMNTAPSKSSISYMNMNRNWELFRDYYFEVLHELQGKGMLRRKGLHNIKRKIYLMDASVIPLCLNLFDWATYRQKKGGVKMHTILDYDGLLPIFCHVTDAKTHEIKVAQSLAFPKGSVLVFDRGYYDFKWYQELNSSRIFFVTRTKSNLDYRIAKEREIRHKDKAVVFGDYIVDIANPEAKKAGLGQLRVVRFYDEQQKREFEFLTNNLIWTATDIALAYKERWNIEVFFKFIKQNLKIKSFVGTSPNAVMIQIWTALIAFVLLKYLKDKATHKWHLSNLVTFIRLTAFTKINLFEWLNAPFEKDEPPPIEGQLKLNF
jgi:hypothetical protein